MDSLIQKAFEANSEAAAPEWVKNFRREGLQRFNALGFPSTHDEEWKYTNVKPIAQAPFKLAEAGAAAGLGLYDEFRDGAAIEIVFIDGHFSPQHSRLNKIPKGLTVEPLEKALTAGHRRIEALLSGVGPDQEDAFTGLNRAFLQRGVFIEAASEAKIETPVFITCITTPAANGRALISRNLIAAGAGAELSVVESYLSLDNPAVYFTNAVTDAHVAQNARLDYCKVHAEGEAPFHVGAARIGVERDGRFRAFNFSRGAAVCRHNLTISILGENAEVALDGLYAVTGKAHVDNHTLVDHREPHCKSDQLYKGILSGNSRAVFNGKVFVRPKAQLTNAYQLNRNLILSKTAQVDTKPQLEIGADDVRCTHGATIGPVNPEEVFYLQTRGIPRAKALYMLSQGYAEDVITKITHPLIREKVEGLLKPFFENCLDELSAAADARGKK